MRLRPRPLEDRIRVQLIPSDGFTSLIADLTSRDWDLRTQAGDWVILVRQRRGALGRFRRNEARVVVRWDGWE